MKNSIADRLHTQGQDHHGTCQHCQRLGWVRPTLIPAGVVYLCWECFAEGVNFRPRVNTPDDYFTFAYEGHGWFVARGRTRSLVYRVPIALLYKAVVTYHDFGYSWEGASRKAIIVSSWSFNNAKYANGYLI